MDLSFDSFDIFGYTRKNPLACVFFTVEGNCFVDGKVFKFNTCARFETFGMSPEYPRSELTKYTVFYLLEVYCALAISKIITPSSD